MKLSKIILILFLCANLPALAQIYSDSSLVTKNYKLSPFTEIEINNKYGDIVIEKTTSDSVLFSIKIQVSTNDSLNLDNYINNIDFAFTESSGKIQVTTIFKPQKSNFLPSIKDFQKLPVGENNMKIDYFVKLPVYTKLKLNNKFGDININETHSEVTAILSNGNFYANTLKGKLLLELQFGMGEIDNMANGDLNLRYVTNLKIEESDLLEIDSKSSKIELQKTERLKLISKRDNIYIKHITHFFVNAFFTKITIDNLLNTFNSESKHSDISVFNVQKELSKFTMNSTFDMLNLEFKKNTAFNFLISEKESTVEFSEKKFSLTQEKDSLNPGSSIYQGFLFKKGGKIIHLNLDNTKLFLK